MHRTTGADLLAIIVTIRAFHAQLATELTLGATLDEARPCVAPYSFKAAIHGAGGFRGRMSTMSQRSAHALAVCAAATACAAERILARRHTFS